MEHTDPGGRRRSLVPATRTGHTIQRLVTRPVMRETCAPLLRRGFGDTSSILHTPPNDTKEKTEQ